jgi:hypothetical protein
MRISALRLERGRWKCRCSWLGGVRVVSAPMFTSKSQFTGSFSLSLLYLLSTSSPSPHLARAHGVQPPGTPLTLNVLDSSFKGFSPACRPEVIVHCVSILGNSQIGTFLSRQVLRCRGRGQVGVLGNETVVHLTSLRFSSIPLLAPTCVVSHSSFIPSAASNGAARC